nr:MAG TPA: hypothetical protein [Caudoviricetes sp.]
MQIKTKRHKVKFSLFKCTTKQQIDFVIMMPSHVCLAFFLVSHFYPL